jgi:hypothetical protein
MQIYALFYRYTFSRDENIAQCSAPLRKETEYKRRKWETVEIFHYGAIKNLANEAWLKMESLQGIEGVYDLGRLIQQ